MSRKRRGLDATNNSVCFQIVLKNESDRVTPKMHSSLMESMREHTVTISQTTDRLERQIIVMAAQIRQIIRFVFKLEVGHSRRQ